MPRLRRHSAPAAYARAPRVIRRRAQALTAAAAVGVLLAGCATNEPTPASSPTPPPAAAATPTAAAPPTPPTQQCADLAASLTQDQQIAQLFMLGIDVGSGEVSIASLETLGTTPVGSVLLVGNTRIGVVGVREITESLRNASPQPDDIGLVIAADQEGGQVQRLRGEGFPDMPSAADQAALSDADLEASAAQWATALKDAGVDYNLAPVADVVPADLLDVNQPIGVLRRGYGSDPATVKAKAQAFIEGMHGVGIATALKHFPGLGQVRGNTDQEIGVTDDVTTTADLETFTGYSGETSVMVSSAIYTQIDAAGPAIYSPIVITDVLRNQLGFDGVVVSDDLGAARAATTLAPADRAVTFLAAGGDLVITVDASTIAEMIDGVRARAASDTAFAASLTDKVARILELKAQTGRADCVPAP